MELKQLSHFVTVVKEGTISGAAETESVAAAAEYPDETAGGRVRLRPF
ncbi:MAG: hypothetical protein ACLVAW_10230 [Eisenbergiella massiliensis]